MAFELVCHPASPRPPIDAIHVDVVRGPGPRLALRYVVTGDIGALAMPAISVPERVDGLWRSTCFEAFVRAPGAHAYAEFNFAPSSRWAAYLFDDYREGMRNLPCAALPRIDLKADPGRFEVAAVVDLTGADPACIEGPALFGLSAVIEERGGSRSFWALAHPPGDPDFHHGDCFTALLDAPPPA
ncbi:MAG: DOMON-like domain-containing protein [Sphingobium sp.]